MNVEKERDGIKENQVAFTWRRLSPRSRNERRHLKADFELSEHAIFSISSAEIGKSDEKKSEGHHRWSEQATAQIIVTRYLTHYTGLNLNIAIHSRKSQKLMACDG